MTTTPDRQQTLMLITEAVTAGARVPKACGEAGIGLRTYRRWLQNRPDGRPAAVRPRASHALTAPERAAVLAVCHAPEFASLPPSQIVPILADRGEYLASESSFYRILRTAQECHHRGRARAPSRRKPPSTHCAEGPRQVWSWDISWLPGPVHGLFFYLYLIMDLYSRKIVGWEIYDRESGVYATDVVTRAAWAEQCVGQALVLHADNGSPMKGSTLKATMERLGIAPSYSRPRVSNDNPYSESLFRTTKYRPDYPHQGFAAITDARDWMHRFVTWYNTKHRHSGIGFVTPESRHTGQDAHTMDQRRRVYAQARAAHPARWSRQARRWETAGPVWLNPNQNDELETGENGTDSISDAA